MRRDPLLCGLLLLSLGGVVTPACNPDKPAAAPADAHTRDGGTTREALEFGMTGLIPSGDGAAVADDGVGSDPLSARGNMWGDAIGEAFVDGGLVDDAGGRGDGLGLGGLGALGKDGASVTGVVKQGPTTAHGGLKGEAVEHIVQQNFGRFRLCYENGLRSDASLRGRVKIRIVIDPSGAVSDAKDDGSDLKNAGTVNCIVRGFKNLTFDEPGDGKEVSVVTTLLLAPAKP